MIPRLRAWLEETHTSFFELVRHFLTAFFDSEMVSIPGEWQKVAIGIFAALFSAGILALKTYMQRYAHLQAPEFSSPQIYREAVRADLLPCIALAMALTALLTIVQWQSLFPSLRDCLALAGLPISTRDIFLAKSGALLLLRGTVPRAFQLRAGEDRRSPRTAAVPGPARRSGGGSETVPAGSGQAVGTTGSASVARCSAGPLQWIVRHHCAAAGVLRHLRRDLLPGGGEDLGPRYPARHRCPARRCLTVRHCRRAEDRGSGIILGIAGSWAAGRLIESLLFDITGRDPLTYAVVAIALLATTILAAYVPALRASRIDPLHALRCE
jgi:hypothetical protein